MLRKEEEDSYSRLSIRRDLMRIGIDAPRLGFSPRAEPSCFPSLLLTAKYEAIARPENTT